MCLATNHLNSIKEIVETYNNEKKKLSEMISKSDKEISKLYHEIEVERYSASEGYKKLRILQEVLRSRRLIKNEFEKMDKLGHLLNLQAIDKSIDKAEKGIQKSLEKHATYSDDWGVSLTDLMEAK